MSSFKNFASMLSDLQQQADGRGTLDGSAIEDFLSIAGYEDPAGGGGGDSDFSTATVKFVIDGSSETGDGVYYLVYIDTFTNRLLMMDNAEPDENMTAVLYKGAAYVVVPSAVSMSGAVEAVDSELKITGDCEIHYIASGSI